MWQVALLPGRTNGFHVQTFLGVRSHVQKDPPQSREFLFNVFSCRQCERYKARGIFCFCSLPSVSEFSFSAFLRLREHVAQTHDFGKAMATELSLWLMGSAEKPVLPYDRLRYEASCTCPVRYQVLNQSSGSWVGRSSFWRSPLAAQAPLLIAVLCLRPFLCIT